MPEWLLVLAGLAVIVGVAWVGGVLAGRVGQPQIAGQLVAVVFVGPTVLGGQIDGVVEGAVATGTVGALFPAASVDVLTIVGSLGLILYMLLVGLTIDPLPMARCAGQIALLCTAVSAATVGVAAGAARWLESDGGWKGPDAGSSAFALALGAALVVNGVPVVARILEERGMLRTAVGAIIIASGAGATTLALIASGVAIKGGDASAAAGFAVILALGAVVLAIAVALARRHSARLTPGIAIATLLGCAVVAGLAGHGLLGTALLGPLVVGIAVNGGGAASASVEARLGAIVRGALLPVFLGVAALHADLRELGPDVFAPVAVLLATVVAVKLAAGYGAVRMTGFSRADAGAVAATLQCGGIMTIAISLAVLDDGLISPRMHAALTLLGLVTTVIAGPLLRQAQRTARVV